VRLMVKMILVDQGFVSTNTGQSCEAKCTPLCIYWIHVPEVYLRYYRAITISNDSRRNCNGPNEVSELRSEIIAAMRTDSAGTICMGGCSGKLDDSNKKIHGDHSRYLFDYDDGIFNPGNGKKCRFWRS